MIKRLPRKLKKELCKFLFFSLPPTYSEYTGEELSPPVIYGLKHRAKINKWTRELTVSVLDSVCTQRAKTTEKCVLKQWKRMGLVNKNNKVRVSEVALWRAE